MFKQAFFFNSFHLKSSKFTDCYILFTVRRIFLNERVSVSFFVLYGSANVGSPCWGECALWPPHLLPLRCEVLHEVKGKRQKPRHTNAHTLSWQAETHGAAHAVDKPSPGTRVPSLGGIGESAGMHLWQVTQFTDFFSPFSLTVLLGPPFHPHTHFWKPLERACDIFNFVTLGWH